MRGRATLAAVLLACMPGLALAADKQGRALVPVVEGAAVSIKPDKAYILFRTQRALARTGIEPVLLRVPTADEMARYDVARAAAFAKAEPKLREARAKVLAKKAAAEAAGKAFKDTVPPEPSLDNFDFAWDGAVNIENVDDGKPFIKGEAEQAYLVEAPPGEYVLYGASYGAGLFRPGLHVCFCLGSVGFAAKAGEITDLGHFLGDVVKERSGIPELAPESGFGPSSDPFLVLIGGTIRPAKPGLAVPAGIPADAVKPAGLHAVGRFFNPGAMGVNRLVPIPGVLGYDRGKVIDLKTGQAVQDVE
jgi:hypothetical protein